MTMIIRMVREKMLSQSDSMLMAVRLTQRV